MHTRQWGLEIIQKILSNCRIFHKTHFLCGNVESHTTYLLKNTGYLPEILNQMFLTKFNSYNDISSKLRITVASGQLLEVHYNYR